MSDRVPSAPSLGVLAEDVQGALAAASRLQQRGLSVQVVQRLDEEIRDVHAVVVDLAILTVPADRDGWSRRWTSHLLERGVTRLETRFDSALRGSPGLCLAGLLDAYPQPDPLILAVPGYPSAGRVCVEGRMVLSTGPDDSIALTVGPALFGQRPHEVIGLSVLTAGPGELADTLIERYDADDGCRRFVLDATADAHLDVAARAAEAVRERDVPLVTTSSGGWLRFHPDLGADGFVIVAAPFQHETDREQLARVSDTHGGRALVTTAGDVLTGSDNHLLDVISSHRVLILHEQDRHEDDPWVLAADFGAAVRRLLDVSAAGSHECQGLLASGGLTTSAIIRALDCDSLRPGQELEPLCPVVRLVGGPYDDLPIISKASGVGTGETLSRLTRRLLGS